MAIIPLTTDNFDNIRLELHPTRSFSSSSLPAGTGSITGSVYVFAERSTFNKETTKLGAFNDSEFDANSLESYRMSVFLSSSLTSSVSASFSDYLSRVNSTAESAREKKKVEVLRFTPTNTFTSDTLRKNVIRKSLFPYYRSWYPSSNWGYTNYHCLNFFTGANVPTSSCLIYPGVNAAVGAGSPNFYNPTGSFSFTFYINPSRTVRNVGDEYRAGTILHMSSAYALSLVTGSHIDQNGFPDRYRILLQLSHSADYNPTPLDLSVANNSRAYPQDLIFLSDDNSLEFNKWQHVAVCWDPNNNDKTGSFYIDGVEQNDSTFIVNSGSINTGEVGNLNPLFVGNFYDGPFSTAEGFFNTTAGATEGVYDGGGVEAEPSGSYLQHPLNAEIHDLRIYQNYLPIGTLLTASREGPDTDLKNLLFYVPPFFTKESPKRNVLITPFQAGSRATTEPYNVELAFGVRGRDINLQNFCRELVQSNYPRLLFLTSSTINESTQTYTANEFLWESASFAPQVRARNLLVMPCDNGKFSPNYNLLKSGTIADPPISGSATDRFVNDLGNLDLTLISLNNMISTASIFGGLTQLNPDGTDNTGNTGILQEIVGTSPESPGVSPGGGYTILQRTRDNSSNEIVVFDASNLFYGMNINPGTFFLRDSKITGSEGRLSLTIRDDGRGNLYRADALTEHAEWSSVGTILYDEGIAVITSPNIPFFGKGQFDVSFEGFQNLHALEINIPAPAGAINSSSNLSYSTDILPSNYANSTDQGFSIISGILFHDDNLNVITKTTMSQPIVKKQCDKYLFRVKIDF